MTDRPTAPGYSIEIRESSLEHFGMGSQNHTGSERHRHPFVRIDCN